jgi:hypothetical protein
MHDQVSKPQKDQSNPIEMVLKLIFSFKIIGSVIYNRLRKYNKKWKKIS